MPALPDVPQPGLGPSAGLRSRQLGIVLRELLASDRTDDVVEIVIQHATDAVGATGGSVSLLVDDHTLALVGVRHGAEDRNAADESLERWSTFPLAAHTPVGEAMRIGGPVVLRGADEADRAFPDVGLNIAADATLLTLPLLLGARARGAITLTFPSGWGGIDEHDVSLRLLTDVCALALDRVEAQEAATDRESKLTFLANTSEELASTLDYEVTLAAVAQAAIPWFADWCTVALAEDGTLRTIAVAHARPELDDLVRQLQEEYPSRAGDGSHTVLETGESILVNELTDDMLREGAIDERHHQLLRQLGLSSVLICSLRVRDRAFGVISWVSSEGGRRFGPGDLSFGESLAQRAAVAIDNARLHTQVRDAALQLQRAVLPARLPELPGWTTSVRYLPAGRTEIGGDFYDLVELPGGRFAAFVGDVMGHGVQAASVVAQVRSAMRTLLALDPDPPVVASGLDQVFEGLQVDGLATLVYVVADPSRNLLSILNAGHPAPLLMRADGDVEELVSTTTMLLGAGGGDREVLDVEFGPGDTLLLFTDGLVERRKEDTDYGTARVARALRDVGFDDVEASLSHLVDTVRDPDQGDDVAALLLRRDPGDPPHASVDASEIRVPPTGSSRGVRGAGRSVATQR